MAHSDSNKQIFCRIRQEWVSAQPEEEVRQKLIDFMIFQRGFPASLIAVEKALQQMPHLATSTLEIPDRRADIICFGKEIHKDYALYPLLLVECKAVKLTDKATHQVVGYNHALQACFVAIANEKEIRTGWFDTHLGEYTFIPQLPHYEELWQRARESFLVSSS